MVIAHFKKRNTLKDGRQVIKVLHNISPHSQEELDIRAILETGQENFKVW
jgi:hypothetical protein